MESPCLSFQSEDYKNVRVGDYNLKTKIREGSYSTVWRAEHVLSGDEVAVKQVCLSRLSRRLKSNFDCEIDFLSSVNHPNIIHLLVVVQEDGYVFLVLEFCAGGNLASYIQRHGRVQQQIARKFMQHLGSALKILHYRGIIHRDLKPENILLSSQGDDSVLKIADFGLSRTLNPGAYAETVCGSPLYMAPEVIQFQKYDDKADMWSVGAILFELLNGYPPFSGRNNVQCCLKVLVLRKCQLGLAGILHITEELAEKNCLEELNLAGNAGPNELQNLQLDFSAEGRSQIVETRKEDLPMMVDGTEEPLCVLNTDCYQLEVADSEDGPARVEAPASEIEDNCSDSHQRNSPPECKFIQQLSTAIAMAKHLQLLDICDNSPLKLQKYFIVIGHHQHYEPRQARSTSQSALFTSQRRKIGAAE